jgi:hypothetical protein
MAIDRRLLCVTWAALLLLAAAAVGSSTRQAGVHSVHTGDPIDYDLLASEATPSAWGGDEAPFDGVPEGVRCRVTQL